MKRNLVVKFIFGGELMVLPLPTTDITLEEWQKRIQMFFGKVQMKGVAI